MPFARPTRVCLLFGFSPPALVSACELFHDVSGKHSATLKLRSVPHQFQQRVFSFTADEGHVADVNDELASTRIGGERSPGLLQFRHPGCDQLSLENDPALRRCIDN